MQPFHKLRSPTFVIPQTDIDTDQIIPARFLTTTSKDGLGEHLFADWRYDENGRRREDAPLNGAAAKAATILVTGNNFGCGSSREHAPWALLDFGFRAVISTEIADIFRSNALKNGLVPIIVDTETHRYLLAQPGVELGIDLDACSVALPDGREIRFEIEAFARHCLLEGIDQLGFLQSQEEAIATYEREHT